MYGVADNDAIAVTGSSAESDLDAYRGPDSAAIHSDAIACTGRRADVDAYELPVADTERGPDSCPLSRALAKANVETEPLPVVGAIAPAYFSPDQRSIFHADLHTDEPADKYTDELADKCTDAGPITAADAKADAPANASASRRSVTLFLTS